MPMRSNKLTRGYGHISDPESTKESPDRCASRLTGSDRGAPSKGSVRSQFFAPEDQLSSNSCVGFAVGAAIEAQARMQGTMIGRVSKLALYTSARSIETPKPNALLDQGCMPSILLAALTSNEGALVSEPAWPFKLESVNRRLPLDVYQSAEGMTIDYFRIGNFARVEQIKRAITLGYSVPFAMSVTKDYESLSIGAVYMGHASGSDQLGSHMQVITGYYGDVFEVRNSWGPKWCDAGYSRIDGDFISSDACSDFYVITAAPRPVSP